MACTLASRILGLVKARALTSAFGAGAVADVINVAYFFPNSLRKLFAEGAADAAIIPGFSRLDDKESRSKLLSIITSFQIALFAIIISLTFIFRYQLFDLMSNFTGESLTLGSNLLPLFMIFLAILSIATVFWSLLKCDRKFLLASLAPLFCSVAIIFFLLYFTPVLGPFSMAYGCIVGAILQLIYCVILVIRSHYFFTPNFHFSSPIFQKTLHAWLVIILSSVITIISQQYSQYLASGLEIGSATAYANAIIFFSAPYGIIFNGIVAVAFTELSDAHAHQDTVRFKNQLSYALTGLISWLVPCAIVMGFLRTEIIATVLQTGKFTFQYTLLTATVLFQLMIGLVIVALKACLYRTMLSRGEAHKTLPLTIGEAIVDIILSTILVHTYHNVASLPLAGNISAGIFLIIYAIILKKDIDFTALISYMGKIVRVNIPVTLLLLFYKSFHLSWYHSGSSLRNLGILCFAGCILGLIVLASYQIAGIPLLTFLKKTKKIQK